MKFRNLLSKLTSLGTAQSPHTTSNGLSVGEGIVGPWHYHLRTPSATTQALCGAHIMRTGISVRAWGVKTHLNERYCAECAALAGERLASSIRAAA